jgi:hypothetical protein
LTVLAVPIVLRNTLHSSYRQTDAFGVSNPRAGLAADQVSAVTAHKALVVVGNFFWQVGGTAALCVAIDASSLGRLVYLVVRGLVSFLAVVIDYFAVNEGDLSHGRAAGSFFR